MKKKMIPVVVAIGLIIIILAIGVGGGLLDKYSYSKEKADLNAYFGVAHAEDTAIILNDEMVETRAIYREGQCYFPIDFVNTNINNHFYYDSTEQVVIFTTDLDKMKTTVGSTDYTLSNSFSSEGYVLTLAENGTVYLSADFLRKFCNFSYAYYPEPGRVLIQTSWDAEEHARIKKDTQVRVLGGIKSEILCEVAKDDSVEILEEMETWTKVITKDGFIGYVENKRLGTVTGVTPEAVTDVPIPQYASIKREGKICLMWNMVTNTTANGLAGDLLEGTQGVNVMSPTWFALSDNEGNFTSLADVAYVENMHARGIEVWALVDNFTYDVDTAAILNSTSKREYLITQLVNTVLSYGIDGINVDFENVTQEASDGYIQFLRELSIECRKNGIVLSADNSHLVNYDRAKQGEVVDYVIIMGYDEHIAVADGPGSVASIEFVQRGIEKTLALVPAEKVINGIPFYTRLWTTTGDIGQVAYGMQEIENYLANHGVETVWDEATCQYMAEFNVDGTGYAVWLEEKESLAVKLNVMNQYNLAGVAGWRLGQEKDDVWPVIAAYLQQ
ncbi:MAG: chitinase [Lachnospiraceae bacterium]|nr:chitinase [Lachnospiraceae bacterium]